MATRRKVERPQATGSAEAGASAGGGSSLDVEALRQIVDILEASDVTRLVWRRGDERLVIRRGAPPVHVAGHPGAPPAAPPPAAAAHSAAASRAAPTPGVAPAAAAAPAEPKAGHVVTSPFVGTFYRTPAPDQPSFVDVGSVVRKGQVLCIVEAMKLMNEIESEVAGRVVEILVENGQPVEYGQALFRIEPV